MKKKIKIIAIDFDGTIVKNKFPEIGEINEDVAEAIRKEKAKGNIIILWTCRKGYYLKLAKKFCDKNNIPIDYYNENYPALPFSTSKKIYADEYWDDRAYNPIDNKEKPKTLKKNVPIVKERI